MDRDLRAPVVFDTGHRHCHTVGRAFAAGCDGRLTRDLKHAPGAGAFYGILRGLGPLLKQWQAAGDPWIYLDNGYFGRGHYDGYYRATLNAYQVMDGEPDYVRWSDLRLSIKPWQKGSKIIICPPGSEYREHHGIHDWLEEVLDTLEDETDRELVIRGKGSEMPLEDDLQDAHALVTHASNAAVDALLAGVPVFCTGDCAASPMACDDLSRIELPDYPEDRERWAAMLAANQWTLNEMACGMAWRHLWA